MVSKERAARPRPSIADSWRRAGDAGVDAGVVSAPLAFDRDVLADACAAHPLGRHLPLLRELLGCVADETEHLLVVTDEAGRALWTQGPARTRRAAERIGLLEGFCWAEGSVGTNGIGTALAEGRPEYVFADEHLAHALRGWSCAGAPVTDPDSGRVIGCLDVSATADRLHPAMAALVATAARLAESRLEVEMRRGDERLRERYLPYLTGLCGAAALVTATGRILAGGPDGWRGRRLAVPAPGATIALPDGRAMFAEPLGEVYLLRPGAGRAGRAGPDGAEPAGGRPLLTLTLLGVDPPVARLDGRPVPLTLRHAEILALLALHPQGLSGDRLSWLLYGDEGTPGTVRAEIHRLRDRLGGLVRARPYRLDCAVDADFRTVRRLLDEGDVPAAARLYTGELLPRSDAPAVRAERDELAVLIRRQALDRGGADALWTYAQTEPGRGDLEAFERLRAVLPPDDPRRAAVATRSDRLLSDDDM